MLRGSQLAVVAALALGVSSTEALEFGNFSYPRHLESTGSCSLENGVDYVGNDIGNVGSAKAEDCCTKCAQAPNCGAFTWTGYNGGTCWLKSSKGETKANPNSQSAQVTADPNGSCNLEQDVDIVGSDLANVPGTAAKDCCTKCGQVAGCNAFTWSSFNGGTCWLKTGRDKTKTTSGVVSASVVRASTCTATEADVDYTGADVGSVKSSTADGCCSKCSQNNDCGAFTWTNFNGGTCWLKSERGSTKPNPGAKSGTVAVQSKCLAIEENVDYNGPDVGNDKSASAEGCCSKCAQRYGCNAFTWTGFNGGTCWFKGSKGNTKANQGAKSGTVVNTAAKHVQFSIRSGETPLRAVNLGSWLVGEQWQSASSPAWRNYNEGWRGEYITMQNLGHQRGDAQFDEHRRTWITEEDISEIAHFGINAVRVPVGFWIVNDDSRATQISDISRVYAPGALKYLDKLINEWAVKYNLAVMLSLHAHQGSQNGYDHSAPQQLDAIDWQRYPENKANSVQFATVLAARYKDSPAFLGMNLMNEPKPPITNDYLKQYYSEVYTKIRATGNNCIIGLSPLMSEQGPGNALEGFMRWPDFTNVWQEWHVYYNEWVYPTLNEWQVMDQIRQYKTHHLDAWHGNYIFMGEWSLAHSPSAPFEKNKALFQQFAQTQMQTLGTAHSGWAFWTWRHDWENSQLCGWSMRQMLREGIIQL